MRLTEESCFIPLYVFASHPTRRTCARFAHPVQVAPQNLFSVCLLRCGDFARAEIEV